LRSSTGGRRLAVITPTAGEKYQKTLVTQFQVIKGCRTESVDT